MARKTKEVKPPEADDVEQDEPRGKGKVKNYARGKGSVALRQAASELYASIEQMYADQDDRENNIEQNWNIFNAVRDTNQQYVGFTEIYDPIISDAIYARTRRRLMQLDPANNVHVQVIQGEGAMPWGHMGLLEHYIRQSQLMNVVRQDLIAGDVTGQWNLFVDWERDGFSITKLVRKNPILREDPDGPPINAVGEDFDDLEEEEVVMEGPSVMAFPDVDLAVVPATVDHLRKAESVTVKLRLTKEGVRKLQRRGYLTEKDTDKLFDKWDKDPQKDPNLQRVHDAGIKVDGSDSVNRYALIWLTHCYLELDGKRRPAWVFWTGPNEIGGIIKCPNWDGMPPVISAAQHPVGGSFKGRPKMENCKTMQWVVNDVWAMAVDSSKYSLMPVVMTDPLSNPNWAAMVMGLAAVWPVDPSKTEFATFPQTWREAMDFADKMKGRIWETMDVNETHVGRAPAGRKNAQQMAAMQIESNIPTMDDAKRYQNMMLEPLMERFLAMDLQYRTEELTILQKGPIGARANLEVIKPQQISQRYWLQWLGVDYQQSLARIQQQIAFINVLRGIPPQFLGGRRIEVIAMLENSANLLFGPEVAMQTIVDERNLYTVDPEVENEMLVNGFHVEVHPADNDPKHIQSHQEAAIKTGDLGLNIRAHLAAHLLQMQKKSQAATPVGSTGPGGAPGIPGGTGPGVPGTPVGGPRPGATPGATRTQGPPGRIPQDTMPDPMAAS